MAQQGLATQAARETAPAIRVGTLPDEIKQMFDSVARRAYEIFESNGPLGGTIWKTGCKQSGNYFIRLTLAFRSLRPD